MIEEVCTERLVGTKPLPRDADELHPICADPRVFGDGTLTLAQTRTTLIKDAAQWKKHRFGRWIWRMDGRVVAHAGLRVVGDDVELAWYVAADRWGEGIATEAARAIVRVAFEEVGLPVLRARTRPDNRASLAIIEGLGMVPDGAVERAGTPQLRFALTNAAS